MKTHEHGMSPMAEINMIPLIDVALILLIIFMVLTPFLVQSQLSVQLPKSSQGSQLQQDNVIRVVIDARGTITVDGIKTPAAKLEKELTLKLSKSAKKTVLVQADSSVKIQKIIEVFDTAKKLGAGKLGIGVVPLPQ